MRMLLTAILLSLAAQAGPLAPANLRCEYLPSGAVVDTAKPRFSWVLEHTDRAQAQTAYQLVVTKEGGSVVWDSGRVASPQSVNVEYAGPALASGTSYAWRVRYADRGGQMSAWSAPDIFEMGLMDPAAWKGKWIVGPAEMRKEFTIAGPVRRARAYVSSLGYYELRLNGERIGDRVLDPAWTTVGKRVLYSTYDVTSLLHSGANAVGLLIGEGRAAPGWSGASKGGRGAILQLNVELANGREVSVVTDESWRAAQGPLISSSVYDGESWDARRETTGWDRAGFDAAGWEPVSVVQAQIGTLSAETVPPVRVTDTITPVKMTVPRPGVYVFDAGQNLSGWAQLRVQGPSGTRVRLRFAELIYPDGMINVENLRAAKATDEYVLRGAGDEEVWEPHFTYHGFRYVEVTGFPGAPTLDSIRVRVVHTDLKRTGGFASSNALLNQIQHNIIWGIESNFVGIPTDCNQRDERLGWTADSHLAGETAILNFDMAAAYSHWVREMRDAQTPAGSVPNVVPNTLPPDFFGDPSWGAAYPLFVDWLYEYYGDRRALEENYDGMKRWADFLTAHSHDGVVDYSWFGDWVPVEKTPKTLAGTIFYLASTEVVARAAKVLGRSADEQKYTEQAATIRAGFDKKFWDADHGVYGWPSQGGQVLALAFRAGTKEHLDGLMGWLTDDIVYAKNTHLTTGILSTKYLLPLLTEDGRADLAYDLAAQTTYPSWGYMVDHGATTIWELWQDKTGPSMNSHNHPMFGSVGAWYYSALAGINKVDDAPGFEKVVIRPRMVRNLTWASGTVDTVRGPVAVAWQRQEGEGLTMRVTIPVGVEAQVFVPRLGLSNPELTESGKPVASAAGISGVKETKDDFVLTAGSGDYEFRTKGE